MPDDDATPLSVHEPAAAPAGGVVVVQEAFGVNDHIEDVCRRLATAGWLAVAPHLYHRTGDPTLPYDDFSQVMPHAGALTRDGVLADLDAALAVLDDAGVAPPSRGVVGFCMGGTLAFHAAVLRPLGAAVTFYGSGVAKGRFGFPPMADAAPDLQAPWLGLFGDLDQGIPVEEVERLRAAAATSAQPTEVVRYPEAGHGFNCDVRDAYHPASAADAWSRTLAWFDRHLKSAT
ncbi:MAG TPA: dienelactone hydrolase family protein [Acidimicrobiales bacterium]